MPDSSGLSDGNSSFLIVNCIECGRVFRMFPHAVAEQLRAALNSASDTLQRGGGEFSAMARLETGIRTAIRYLSAVCGSCQMAAPREREHDELELAPPDRVVR